MIPRTSWEASSIKRVAAYYQNDRYRYREEVVAPRGGYCRLQWSSLASSYSVKGLEGARVSVFLSQA